MFQDQSHLGMRHLIAIARQRSRSSQTLKALCTALESYTHWDNWRMHPLCFLSLPETHVVQWYLQLGTFRAVADAKSCTTEHVHNIVRRSIARLEAGQQDYQALAPFVVSGKPFPEHQIQHLILARPFILFNLPAATIRGLAQSGFSCFEEIHASVGIHRFLESTPCIDAEGFIRLRQQFENLGMQHLLQPPAVVEASLASALHSAGQVTCGSMPLSEVYRHRRAS